MLKSMKRADAVAAVLVVIGAVNWGLVGLFQLDLVAAIFGMNFGQTSTPTSVVYTLVGFAGLWLAASAIRSRSHAIA
jgi:uncharacterized protein